VIFLGPNVTTMTNLENYLDTIQEILQDVCKPGVTISKKIIYDIFSKKHKTNIERYKFSKEISELIHSGKIKGYSIKVGRNGGITKEVEPLPIKLTYPGGEVIKNISPETLQKILVLI